MKSAGSPVIWISAAFFSLLLTFGGAGAQYRSYDDWHSRMMDHRAGEWDGLGEYSWSPSGF
jgi:hypothetical protein